jgi:hypothetical protein
MTKFPMRNELTTAELHQVVTNLIIALKRLSEAHGFQIQLDPRMPAVEAMRNTLNETEMNVESALAMLR